MRLTSKASALLAATAALSVAIPAAQAADAPAKADVKPAGAETASLLPAFPPEASVKQTMVLHGRTLNYTATVGALPVRDETGKKIAEVVVTTYTLDGPRTRTDRSPSPSTAARAQPRSI